MDEAATNEIVRDCMISYGTYVLEDRAVPDIRDGLKPSQRRLLWSMYQMGLQPNKPSVKSARVVGRCIGMYHPHGDAAIYDTLVNLTRLRHPLVHGDGNFGNRDILIETKPAQHRYTECRLLPLAAACFDEIHVAEQQANYDDSTEEPIRLPVPVPLALVNGCSGIAVGLTTHIPPHNLGEVLDALLHLLDEPGATTDDLLRFIKGPDYGTGVLLSNKADLLEMYETGQGKLQLRSTYEAEQHGKQQKLVITGLAPGIQKKKFYDTCTELYRKKLIESPVTDESTLDRRRKKFHYRDTIQYRDPQIVRDRLLPLLEKTTTYQWYCLDQQKLPRRYTLLELLHEFLDYRREIETAVLQDRKQKLQRRLGIVSAKYRAVKKIDEVVEILKTAETPEVAVKLLMKQLKLKEDWQAEAVLEAPLRSLMALQAPDLKQQGQKLRGEIRGVQEKLSDIDSVVRQQLTDVRKYATPRGTRLRGAAKDFGEDHHYWVGITQEGKIEVSLDLPTKSRAAWNYCSFFQTDGEFVVVHDTNRAQIVHVSYLDRYEPQGKVVGAVPLANCCVVTNRGRYVAFKTQQKRRSFPVFKDLGDDTIVAAIGFDSQTRIALWLDDGQLVLRSTGVSTTRPNVKARKLRLKTGVTAGWSHPAGVVLVDLVGQELGEPERLDRMPYLVGERNLLSLQAGQRRVLSRDETMELISTTQVQAVVPIPTAE